MEGEVFVDEYGNVLDQEADGEDKDLAAKAKAFMASSVDKDEVNGSPVKKQVRDKHAEHFPNRSSGSGFPMFNSVYKDLDNVRDITLPPQEIRPRMPMFKSNYIEPKDSVLSRGEQKQYLKLMQMFKNPMESSNVQSMEDFNLYQSYKELVTQEQIGQVSH